MNNFSDLSSVVSLLNGLLVTGAALILLPMLLYAAFIYLTGGSSSDSVSKAQGIGTAAIIGMLIVVLALVIVNLAYTVLGSPTGSQSSPINPFVTQ